MGLIPPILLTWVYLPLCNLSAGACTGNHTTQAQDFKSTMGSKTSKLREGGLAFRAKKSQSNQQIAQSSQETTAEQRPEPGEEEEPESAYVEQLCSACSKLDLGRMISEEVKETPIGLLSHYIDRDCPFCHLISQSIAHAWGPGWTVEKLCLDSSSAVHLYARSQSFFTTTKNGYKHHPQPRLLLAVDAKPPGYQRNRPAIREIDRVKNRYIIAEIEAFPEFPEENLLPRREVGKNMDVELVTRWLQECLTHKHSQAASKRDSRLFSEDHPFRLIDVIDECLVLKSQPCDYVALSYVWGPLPTILSPANATRKDPILLSTDANINELAVPKSLSRSQRASNPTGRIPGTIRDAMELVRQSGMRYLWVDTLCIIQDNADDKANMIGRMDDVYDNAMVTVIAADGKDADAGLPGISPRQGHLVEPVKIAGNADGETLCLSRCLPSLCDEARKANWITRGWTFQEQCLSQRALYFTADEIFFNCSQVQWREGYDHGEKEGEPRRVDVRTGPPWWNANLRNDPDPTPYLYLGNIDGKLDAQSYQMAVQDYSRKNLTYAHDVFNAFEGIFNRFKGSGDLAELTISQTQGIPSQILYQGILWFPPDNSKKRVCDEQHFSSWSWASWTGPIDFVFAESDWLSRNISHAVIKRKTLHVPITCWYYGETGQKFWSHSLWQAAGEEDTSTLDRKTSDELTRTKAYLNENIGIDVEQVLSRLETEIPTGLSVGDLGFFAPYVPSTGFRFSFPGVSEQVHPLEVGAHRGQFRYDSDEVEDIDELVPIVAGDTITKEPDVYSILLGFVTRDGVSRRVGIAYLYYSKDADVAKPPWEYRIFHVR